MGVNRNTEVLVPALNYIASANSVVQLGGSPHFVDVEEETLGPDVKRLDTYLSKQLEKHNRLKFRKVR